MDPGSEGGHAAVVLEAGQGREPGLERVGEHLAHRPPPATLHRRHVEEPDAGVGPPRHAGEDGPDDLVARADRKHHRTVLHGSNEPAVGQQHLRRLDLRPVLTTAKTVEIAGRERLV
jgi:hypothetical protein